MPSSLHPCGLLFVLLVLVPFLARAQTPTRSSGTPTDSAGADSAIVSPVPPDTLPLRRVRLPPLTIEAVPSPPSSTAPTPVTPLDFGPPEETSGRTVDDLLAERTNLFVRQRGPTGRSTVSSRGLGSQQTRILVDGQRVADPQTGQTDLSLLPAVLIESAQVRHGSQAGRYGSGTLGGVVSLRTRSPSAPLQVEATSGRGAFGWRTTGGLVSSAGDRWSGLVAAEGTWTDGDFPFDRDAPNVPERRQNADRRHATVFGKVTRDGDKGTSSARLWWTDVDRGLPGTANAPPSDASQRDRQWRLGVDHRHSLPNGTLRIAARGQDSFLRFQNPDPDPRFAQDDTTRTQRATLKTTADLALRPDLFLTTGLTVGHDRAALRDGVHRWRMGIFADASWTLGSLTLHPALRLDVDRPSGPGRPTTALSPQVGAVWQPGPSWLRLKGQVGRAFRTPTFNERFFEPGGTPSLKAESGWSAEAGVQAQVDAARYGLGTEVTLFTTRLTDQIVWQPSFVGPGLQVWRPSNVGTVRTRGVEWSANGHWRFGDQLAADALMTFTHVAATNRTNPRARSFGSQLPHRPRQRLKARTTLSWRQVRLGLSSRWVGRRYVTRDETQALDPFQVTDVRLEITQSLGPATVTASARVRNVFDTQYSVVRLHPMPTRHVRTRLSIRFHP